MLDVQAAMGRGALPLREWGDDADVRHAVQSRLKSLCGDLIRISRIPPSRRRRGKIYWLLRSFNAKFCCLFMAWPSYIAPVSLAELELMASSLNPRLPFDEVIWIKPVSKSDGTYRPICVFGPERRALQKLADTLLHAIWGPLKFDHAVRGKGRNACIEKVISAIEPKGGPKYAVTADIKNAFGSFNREKMKKLIPIPNTIIEHSLFILEGTFTSTHTTLDQAVLRGLPQGSLASSYIAGKLIEPQLFELEARLTVAYADDILVAAARMDDALAKEQTLIDLMRDHPAGPLVIKSQVARLGQPIDFLGYRFRRRWIQYGGGVRLTPSPKSFDKFEKKIVEKLAHVAVKDLDRRAFEYTTSWMNSHPSWDRSTAGDQMVWGDVETYFKPAARAERKKLYPAAS